MASSGRAWRSARRFLSSAGKQEAPSRRKRFYKNCGVLKESGGWYVTLDGRKVPTPSGTPLALSSGHMALSLSAEWDAQVKYIEPATMPLTSLAATAVDQIAKARAKATEGLIAYAQTDTCRFFADGAAEPYVKQKQEALFTPLLDWLATEHGVTLEKVPPGVFRAPPIDDGSHVKLTHLCDVLSLWELAALQCATFECKSLTIGLALILRQVDAKAAEEAARIEESANIERWGLVEGAHDYDLARIQVQLASASFFADAARMH